MLRKILLLLVCLVGFSHASVEKSVEEAVLSLEVPLSSSPTPTFVVAVGGKCEMSQTTVKKEETREYATSLAIELGFKFSAATVFSFAINFKGTTTVKFEIKGTPGKFDKAYDTPLGTVLRAIPILTRQLYRTIRKLPKGLTQDEVIKIVKSQRKNAGAFLSKPDFLTVQKDKKSGHFAYTLGSKGAETLHAMNKQFVQKVLDLCAKRKESNVACHPFDASDIAWEAFKAVFLPQFTTGIFKNIQCDKYKPDKTAEGMVQFVLCKAATHSDTVQAIVKEAHGSAKISSDEKNAKAFIKVVWNNLEQRLSGLFLVERMGVALLKKVNAELKKKNQKTLQGRARVHDENFIKATASPTLYLALFESLSNLKVALSAANENRKDSAELRFTAVEFAGEISANAQASWGGLKNDDHELKLQIAVGTTITRHVDGKGRWEFGGAVLTGSFAHGSGNALQAEYNFKSKEIKLQASVRIPYKDTDVVGKCLSVTECGKKVQELFFIIVGDKCKNIKMQKKDADSKPLKEDFKAKDMLAKLKEKWTGFKDAFKLKLKTAMDKLGDKAMRAKISKVYDAAMGADLVAEIPGAVKDKAVAALTALLTPGKESKYFGFDIEWYYSRETKKWGWATVTYVTTQGKKYTIPTTETSIEITSGSSKAETCATV